MLTIKYHSLELEIHPLAISQSPLPLNLDRMGVRETTHFGEPQASIPSCVLFLTEL